MKTTEFVKTHPWWSLLIAFAFYLVLKDPVASANAVNRAGDALLYAANGLSRFVNQFAGEAQDPDPFRETTVETSTEISNGQTLALSEESDGWFKGSEAGSISYGEPVQSYSLTPDFGIADNFGIGLTPVARNS